MGMTDSLTIILASRSPRRAALLAGAGYRFVQADPPFDDPPQPRLGSGETPQALAQGLAAQKARSLINNQDLPSGQNTLILAADTVLVAPDDTLLGQPCDRQGAQRMLTLLINATHRVHTGVALVDPVGQRSHEFTDTAGVQLGHVTATQLTAYLDTQQWQGKAGGYNLFDLQDHWPFTVTGDPTTVVGLPMRKLARYLAAWPDTPQGTEKA